MAKSLGSTPTGWIDGLASFPDYCSSGALMAQQEGYADASRGLVIVGLASLLLERCSFQMSLWQSCHCDRIGRLLVSWFGPWLRLASRYIRIFNVPWFWLSADSNHERSETQQMTVLCRIKNVTKAVSKDERRKSFWMMSPWNLSMILSRFWGQWSRKNQPSLIPLLGRFRWAVEGFIF